MSDPIVGIDLGTSNAVVAHADGTGAVTVLADDSGAKIHPAVVSFHPGGGVVVGAAAKQRKVIDPQHTIYSVKRLIGRGYRSAEVQTMKARVPFQIEEGAHQLPMIATRAGELAIPEISAIVLDHLRHIATARLGAEVTRAVVTVPASFGDAQRSATATAGAIAGLAVVRVLNEPTAAALAYGHARALSDVIAVYDWGGGTFDVSILKLDDGVYEVLGTAGDTFLGGDDLDERLVERMVASFRAEHRVDLRENEVSMMRLRAVAEQTKIELSRRSRAVVRVDEIAYGPRGAPLALQIEITRDELVRDIAGIVDRTFPVCQEALQLAGVPVDRIRDVLLVGGTTKIPYVREQVSRFFQQAPRVDVGAEDAVAVGAALQAAALEPAEDATGPTALGASAEPVGSRPDSEPTLPRPDTSYSVTRGGTKDTFEGRAPSSPGTSDDRTPPPQALPLARVGRPPTAEPPLASLSPSRASLSPPPIPPPRMAARSSSSSTLDIPTLPRTAPPPAAPTMIVTPPELSAASTARGFGAPSPVPPPRAPVVLEVTPRGLGIATVGGYCEELIRRNSRVPTAMKKLFATARDRQEVVRIVVCQGEARRLEQNVVIGDLVLAGLPPRPRGETSIEVTFSLDASGILQVHARDALTGAEQHAQLDLLGGMQPQDVAASRDRLQTLRR